MTSSLLDVDAQGSAVGTASVFKALMLRDAHVLRKNLRQFIPRTIMQPVLLVFVFAYVFPKIGQGVGGSGGAESFSLVLVAGVLGSVIFSQGLQAVAFPMVQDFGFTREIEGRAMAPMRIELIALQKIAFGACQCFIAAMIVFPLAYYVPATAVSLEISWPTLILITPLACLMSASLGLMFGTVFDPYTVPLMFGVIVIPITFLGCIYYPWQALEGVAWLQVVVLLNPLVYMSEGFRGAITPLPHLSLWACFAVMISFTILFAWVGVRGFRRRFLS